MRVLVTGAGGQLGRDVVDALGRDDSIEVTAAGHGELAVQDQAAVDELIGTLRPEVIIHAAALTKVDLCEEAPQRAHDVNATGTRNVAEAAERVGAHLLYVSTDYVFDGRGSRPYRESDETNPISAYGASKLAGEQACPEGATIVRTSWVCGVHGANFVRTVLELGRRPGELRFVDDQRGSPTFTEDLAPAVIALALDRRPGCFHVTNRGDASRFELARETLADADADPDRAIPISTGELKPVRPATRPAYSVLDNSAFVAAGYQELPPWQNGLSRLVAKLNAPTR
jgi:dTDP-4-dehydrorhamnose reductase